MFLTKGHTTQGAGVWIAALEHAYADTLQGRGRGRLNIVVMVKG